MRKSMMMTAAAKIAAADATAAAAAAAAAELTRQRNIKIAALLTAKIANANNAAAAPDTAVPAVSGSAAKRTYEDEDEEYEDELIVPVVGTKRTVKIAASAAGRKLQIDAANQTKFAKIAAENADAAAAASTAASITTNADSLVAAASPSSAFMKNPGKNLYICIFI
jgi:hypothetical protein